MLRDFNIQHLLCIQNRLVTVRIDVRKNKDEQIKLCSTVFVTNFVQIVVYVLLITKAINIAKTARDDIGSYIAIGIAGVFLFHMIENIGMTMGLLPITGVPLLFLSYGGSFTISLFLSLLSLLTRFTSITILF